MIDIVLTTDNSFFSRLARLLGAEWTHAMLRFPAYARFRAFENTAVEGIIQEAGFNVLDSTFCIKTYRIIEAGFRHGVIERAWNPDEYSKWAVYRRKEPMLEWESQAILEYARGNKGKRYAFEKLLLLIPPFLKSALARTIIPREEAAFITSGLFGEGHICTSLVDDCFMEIWDDLVPDIDTPWVLPDNIRDSPLLELLPPEGTVEWREKGK